MKLRLVDVQEELRKSRDSGGLPPGDLPGGLGHRFEVELSADTRILFQADATAEYIVGFLRDVKEGELLWELT